MPSTNDTDDSSGANNSVLGGVGGGTAGWTTTSGGTNSSTGGSPVTRAHRQQNVRPGGNLRNDTRRTHNEQTAARPQWYRDVTPTGVIQSTDQLKGDFPGRGTMSPTSTT